MVFLTPFADELLETRTPVETTTVAANQSLIDPLTNRELEVLQLIADGLTNRQIGDKLVISTGTVKYYTSHIYRKLQVSNRTQAVASAREIGIFG
jgi:LuxR family maltose regulon positive regulatory protein